MESFRYNNTVKNGILKYGEEANIQYNDRITNV